MSKSVFKSVNMLEGNIAKNLIIFAIPLIASGFLQTLYNSADMMVLGSFVGDKALASVGATAATYNLIVNVFIGIGAGISVVISQLIGADKKKDVIDAVHTTAALGIIVGIIIATLGLFISPMLLRLVNTPSEIFDGSVLYLRIMFMGAPALTLYNFGAAISRATGDTRRPFIYLAVSGALNVLFNLFFVLVLNMTVDGVAFATIIAQYLSALFIWVHLSHTHEFFRFEIRKIRIVKKQAWDIIRIGFPTGVQSSLFSLSNLIIQTAVNSLGTAYIAGMAASSNVDHFMFNIASGLSQSTMVFAGQNTGAKKIRRVKSLLGQAMVTMVLLCFATNALFFAFRIPILKLFVTEPLALKAAETRVIIMCATQFIAGLYEVTLSVIRGMGYSLTPMLAALFGVCGTRVIWVYLIFPLSKTFPLLLGVYPVSWLITLGLLLVLFSVYYPRLKRKIADDA